MINSSKYKKRQRIFKKKTHQGPKRPDTHRLGLSLQTVGTGAGPGAGAGSVVVAESVNGD